MDWPFTPFAIDPPVLNNSSEWMRQTGLAPIATSATWSTTNKAILTPVRVRRRMTVKKLYCFNGSVVSGNACIALYRKREGAHTTFDRLTSSGSVAQAGVSQWQAFDVTDYVIGPGMYWLVYQLDNTTGTVTRLVGLTGTSDMLHFLGNIRHQSNPSFPMNPTEFCERASGNANVPLLAMGGIA